MNQLSLTSRAVDESQPGARWRQSFDAFEAGERVVALYAARRPCANVAV